MIINPCDKQAVSKVANVGKPELKAGMAILLALVIVFLLNGFFLSTSSNLDAQTESQSAEKSDNSERDKTADPETKPQLSLKSPRRSLRTFLISMERKDYATAITALDFSKVDPAPDSFAQVKYASQLNACLQQLLLVENSQVSDVEEGPPVPFPPQQSDSLIVLVRCADNLWRFSPETVANVESIFKIQGKSSPKKQPPAAKPAAVKTSQVAPLVPHETKNVEAPKQAAPVPVQLESARRAMRTLFNSFEIKDYSSAVSTLDFSEMQKTNPELSPYVKLSVARRLRETIERLAFVDYSKISDDPMGPAFRFPPDQINQPVEIMRLESGVWKFTTDTVDRIDALYEVYKDKPILNLPEEERHWYMRELVLGNETWRIIALFGAIFLSLLIGQVLRGLFRWRSNIHERCGHLARSAVYRTLAKAAVGLLFLVGLRAGISALVLDHNMESVVMTVLRVIFTLVVGYICFRLVDVVAELLHKLLTRRSGSSLNQMIVPIVTTAMKLTVVIVVLLEIAIAVSDQPPSAVLAGLGAGGLAIGLAAQETIKNLFGSVMIFADRPFELGERVIVDGHDGPVEAVGFRSTRIRTLEGHIVTVPNGEMANKTIQNIGKRQYIRRTMNIRIASDTPAEKIRRALEILRELLTDHQGMNAEHPPRIFLDDFLESAINLRAIYWYFPPDYWEYCAFCEWLNLQVIEQFHDAGVRFAVPSQQIFLTGDQK